MKLRPQIIALLWTFLLLAGCKPSDEAAPASPNLQQAKQDANATMQDLKAYTYAQKTAFVQKMRDELAELNKEIDALGEKIDQSTDEVKAAAKPRLDALRAQADKLKVQLDKAEDATETTWDDFKTSAGAAYDGLKNSCNDARQWLAEKIAPKTN